MKNIGLNVEKPSTDCDDHHCPFHGQISIRGKLIQARLTLEQEKAGLIDQADDFQNESRRQEDSLRSQINLMASKKGLLEKEKTELEQKIDSLIQQQKDDTKEKAALSTRLSGSEDRYRLTKKELDYLVSKHAEEISEFEKEKTLLIENLQAFDLLKSQYGELEIAYNRLVRPARNEVGRYRVEVRYWKANGRFHYSIKEPGEAIETEVSEEGLHERLGKLQEAHPGKLFTHVIFPGGKDISHEEAYLFERSIVSQYDYYYSYSNDLTYTI